MQVVSFYKNKIKYVEPELVSTLMKMQLKYLSFSKNFNVNIHYDADRAFEESSLEQLKFEVVEKCQMPDEFHRKVDSMKKCFITHSNFEVPKEFLKEIERLRDQVKDLKEYNEDLMEQNEILSYEILDLTDQNKELKGQNNYLKGENQSLKVQKAVLNQKMASFMSDRTKDFTITVKDREFKVHKFLLIARSQVFAEMIENNPGACNFKLEFISLDTIQYVLDYMYNDAYPQNGASFKDIFIASGRLKIEKLMDYAAIKLINQLNAENAFDMLSLANKYDHDGLRMEAFQFVKEMFPDQKLDDEISANQQCIEELHDFIKTKAAMEKKLKENLRSLMRK
jgi:BTB/POZ domain